LVQEGFVLTRRDCWIAVLAAGLTAGGFALAQQRTSFRSWTIDWNSVPAKTTSSGAVRSFFNGRTATLDNLEIHVTTLNPGQSPHPPHRHPHEEMLIVKEGKATVLINGQWKTVGPGSVIFFTSNVLHGIRNDGTVPLTYHVIAFKTAATPAQ
jgi:XRE family transcriptional regulator, regulator of sulfur utilization